jgi:hypothetical protein
MTVSSWWMVHKQTSDTLASVSIPFSLTSRLYRVSNSPTVLSAPYCPFLTSYLAVADEFGYDVHAVHRCLQDAVHRDYIADLTSRGASDKPDPQRVFVLELPSVLWAPLVRYFTILPYTLGCFLIVFALVDESSRSNETGRER